jgi:hypothetical protein
MTQILQSIQITKSTSEGPLSQEIVVVAINHVTRDIPLKCFAGSFDTNEPQ